MSLNRVGFDGTLSSAGLIATTLGYLIFSLGVGSFSGLSMFIVTRSGLVFWCIALDVSSCFSFEPLMEFLSLLLRGFVCLIEPIVGTYPRLISPLMILGFLL